MIDIEDLATRAGCDTWTRNASGDRFYVFAPDDLCLFKDYVWQAAQAAERERAKGLVDALNKISRAVPHTSFADEIISAAIAKYEGKANEP